MSVDPARPAPPLPVRASAALRACTDVAATLGADPRTLRVLLDERGRAVIAGGTAGGARAVAVKAVASAAEAAGEAAALRRAREFGVPVPDLLHVQTDPPVLVTAWVPGEPLSSAQPRTAAVDAGGILARLHAHPADGVRPWWPHLHEWTREDAAWWAAADPAAAGTAQELVEWCEELRPFVDRPAMWVLRDGRTDHVLVAAGRVVGVIDVADLDGGDGAEDLAVLALHDPALLPGLLAGYAAQWRAGTDESAAGARDGGGWVVEEERLRRVLPLYMALRLVAAARWQSDSGVRLEQVPGFLRRAAHLVVAR